MTFRRSSCAYVALPFAFAMGCATSAPTTPRGPDAVSLPSASLASLDDFRSKDGVASLLPLLPPLANAAHLHALVAPERPDAQRLVTAAGTTPLFDVVMSLPATLRVAGATPALFDFEALASRAAAIAPLSRYASPAEKREGYRRLCTLELLAWHLVIDVAMELGGPLADDAFINELPRHLSHYGATALEALVPADAEYSALLSAKVQLESLATAAAGEETTLPIDKEWYPTLYGTKKPRIVQLRKRLAELGYFAPPVSKLNSFDSSIERELRAFQERHGLEASGRPNEESVRALNVPIDERVGEVIAALRQRRQDPQRGIDDRLVLNIPAFELRRIVGGKTQSVHRVVVGSNQDDIDPFAGTRGPINRTPALSTTITQIVLNPTWAVPRRIKELILDPLADHDPRRYDDFRLTVGPDGVEQATQLPGPKNALGQVKFILRGSDTVLHATPGRRLFEERKRALSHGDVRVENAMTLATTLLAHDAPNMPRKRVESLLRTRNETFVTLKRPVPIQLRYSTVDVDSKGQVRFYPDVYNLGTSARVEGEVAGDLAPPE